MTALLTDDLIVALHDPDSGKSVVDSTHTKAVIAGAVVLDLIALGRLRLTTAEDPSGLKAGRLAATGVGPPLNPAWADAEARCLGEKPKNAVARIGGGSSFRDRITPIRDEVAQRLGSGLVAEVQSVLGFSRVLLHPDRRLREGVLGRVRAVVDASPAADPRDRSLVALLHAASALHKVLADRDRRELKRRGKEICEGDWGSEAVAAAIRDVESAVVGAIVATTAAASST